MAIVGIGGDDYPGTAHRLPRRPQRRGVLHRRPRRRWRSSSATTAPRCAWSSPSRSLSGSFLCYSRTGLLAGVFAVIWICVRPSARAGRRRGPGRRAGLDRQQHPGGPDHRSGRSPIARAATTCASASSPRSTSSIANAPWYGNGPGTAKVMIRDLEFFFHNSYLATRQEGGLAGAAARPGPARLHLRPPGPPARTRRPEGRGRAGRGHRRRRSWPSPSARCCSTPRWASSSASRWDTPDPGPGEPTRWLSGSTWPPTTRTSGAAS